MKLSEFHIGLEFLDPCGLRCRCTDIGKRTVIAIYLDRDHPVWYQGPPYIVREMVFDETYIENSYPDQLALLEGRLAQARNSAHPGFSASNFVRIVDESERDGDIYPNREVLRFDRVGSDGEILHPYSARRTDDDTWTVRIFLLFPQSYAEMPEREFIRLPIATEDDMRRRADALRACRDTASPNHP
ncbi:hypothetical protein [Paraburkholderia azotifigens]|uniref:Uncharacterized protein n=1 Tax=Paraburkholderia azotifigens TaxID=2057004 RepID=A0A5C6V2L5_9BURK|nr:hypothetical protein [Paraburkholderia azotifigens]TXC79090.1 hypothetical protein FRZ40_32200 [Paraburkholderia azotifigens]